MAEKKESPFISHIFVCTNDRGGKRKSCADNNSQLVRSKLKKLLMRKAGREKSGSPSRAAWASVPKVPMS